MKASDFTENMAGRLVKIPELVMAFVPEPLPPKKLPLTWDLVALNSDTYVPPPPKEMLKCMNDLEDFINGRSDFPPLIRQALIHYQFVGGRFDMSRSYHATFSTDQPM